MKYWQLGLAVIAGVAVFARLQDKVLSLETASKDTVKSVATHDIKLAEFSVEQRVIRNTVEKIEVKQDALLEAIQKIRR